MGVCDLTDEPIFTVKLLIGHEKVYNYFMDCTTNLLPRENDRYKNILFLQNLKSSRLPPSPSLFKCTYRQKDRQSD